jgi:hypothetical protein
MSGTVDGSSAREESYDSTEVSENFKGLSLPYPTTQGED